MNVNDVKDFYRVSTNIELASKLSITNVTVTNWKNKGIPYEQQCVLYYESKHKLKPDRRASAKTK